MYNSQSRSSQARPHRTANCAANTRSSVKANDREADAGEMRNPPNRGAIWVAAHAVVGSLVLGAGFAGASVLAGAILGITTTGPVVLLLLFSGFVGTSMALAIRRNVRQWDADHPPSQ
jgi:hypothetical protein